jgi:predicted ATP-grasp superfamily ATP-dependent carboligase
MPSTLIILGSSMTALAVLRDAVAHGLAVVVVDTEPGLACASRWGRKLIRPQARADDLLDDLLGLAPGSALIATSDHWLEFIVRHRSRLQQAFEAILHPANAALEVCLSKHRFAHWCREVRVPAPLSWFVGAEARPAGLVCPVILRPARTRHQGAASDLIPKALELGDEAALTHWLACYARQDCQAVVSESLLGRRLVQYSVPYAAGGIAIAATGGALAQAGALRAPLLAFVACKRRPLPDRCGVGTFVELSPQAEVLRLARQVIDALGLVGIGEVEMLHDAVTGENFLIEINARPWMQYALAPASGHDFLATALGQPAASSMRRRRRLDGLGWVDLKPDLFNAFSRRKGAVRKGEIHLTDYLLSLLRMNVFAKFAWCDPWPGLLGWRCGPRAAQVALPRN